jgi:peroxiredoxin
MTGRLLGWAGFILSLGILAVFAMPTYRQGERSIAGRRAPDFALELDGQATRLTNLQGKVVALNFWASWCPPCVEETPSLNALHERIAERGGMVLGVSLDDDQAAYEKFLKEHNVVFPNHRDPTKDIPAAYGTAMYPETYLIGRDGRIARKIVGPQDWTSPEMLSVFSALLGEPSL